MNSFKNKFIINTIIYKLKIKEYDHKQLLDSKGKEKYFLSGQIEIDQRNGVVWDTVSKSIPVSVLQMVFRHRKMKVSCLDCSQCTMLWLFQERNWRNFNRIRVPCALNDLRGGNQSFNLMATGFFLEKFLETKSSHFPKWLPFSYSHSVNQIRLQCKAKWQKPNLLGHDAAKSYFDF